MSRDPLSNMKLFQKWIQKQNQKQTPSQNQNAKQQLFSLISNFGSATLQSQPTYDLLSLL